MHLYLEVAPKLGLYNYRGVLGPFEPAPANFAKVMHRSNLRVAFTPELIGEPSNEPGGLPRGVPHELLKDYIVTPERERVRAMTGKMEVIRKKK